MISIKQWFKLLFHRCEYKDFRPMKASGVTMGWNLKPTIEYTSYERCTQCSKEKTQPWVFNSDHIIHPENYDSTGRPLPIFEAKL
jgi:hypothetical protein